MKLFIICFSFLLLQKDTNAFSPQKFLSQVPVCGSFNGYTKTFASALDFYETYKSSKEEWKYESHKPCPEVSECKRYQPVCGVSESNAFRNFTNICLLEGANKESETIWEVHNKGSCPTDNYKAKTTSTTASSIAAESTTEDVSKPTSSVKDDITNSDTSSTPLSLASESQIQIISKPKISSMATTTVNDVTTAPETSSTPSPRIEETTTSIVSTDISSSETTPYDKIDFTSDKDDFTSDNVDITHTSTTTSVYKTKSSPITTSITLGLNEMFTTMLKKIIAANAASKKSNNLNSYQSFGVGPAEQNTLNNQIFQRPNSASQHIVASYNRQPIPSNNPMPAYDNHQQFPQTPNFHSSSYTANAQPIQIPQTQQWPTYPSQLKRFNSAQPIPSASRTLESSAHVKRYTPNFSTQIGNTLPSNILSSSQSSSIGCSSSQNPTQIIPNQTAYAAAAILLDKLKLLLAQRKSLTNINTSPSVSVNNLYAVTSNPSYTTAIPTTTSTPLTTISSTETPKPTSPLPTRTIYNGPVYNGTFNYEPKDSIINMGKFRNYNPDGSPSTTFFQGPCSSSSGGSQTNLQSTLDSMMANMGTYFSA